MTEYMTLTAQLPEGEPLPESVPVDPDPVTPAPDAVPVEPQDGAAPDTAPEDAPEEDPDAAPEDAPAEAPDAEPEDAPDAKPQEDLDAPTGDAETTGAEDGTETGELVEVPDTKEPIWEKFDTLTLSLMGAVLVLAAFAAVLGGLLLRKKKSAAVLPAQPVAGGGTITIGKVHEIGDRDSQQDCFAVSPVELNDSRGLLAVVADGMGGLADGDKVSEAVVTAMMDGFLSGSEAGNILLPLAEQANRKVNQLLGPAGIGKSGSTMVAGLVREGAFHYISIGDSRICLFRDGQLMQLNREHVYQHELSIQALNGIGTLNGAVTHSKAAGLTSYLGMGQLKYVDIPAEGIAIREGDKFILMSDGVYNALPANELSEALMNDAEKAAEMIREKITEKAYRNQDNYSAVILAC